MYTKKDRTDWQQVLKQVSKLIKDKELKKEFKKLKIQEIEI